MNTKGKREETRRVRFITMLGLRLTLGICFLATGAPMALADLRSMWSQENGQIIPLVMEAGTVETRLFGETVFFITEDSGGRLVYTWELPVSAKDPPLGRITVQGKHEGGESRVIPVAGDAKLDWVGELGASRSNWEPAGEGRYKMVRKFQVDGEIVRLNILGRLSGKSLVLELMCDQPVVSRILPGHFGMPIYKDEPEPEPELEAEAEPAEGEVAEKEEEEAKPKKPSYPPGFNFFMRRMGVPFLSEEVRGFVEEKLFASVISDWRVAGDAGRGQYAELSDGSRLPLVARFIYTASWDIDEVMPNIPNAPGPHREEAAQRILVEYAGKAPYEMVLQRLETLVGEGKTNYLVLLHEWQNKGPEALLPTHAPAGGDFELLEELGKFCRKHGIRLALREEYSDMYQGYERYDDKYLCLDAEGAVRTGYKPRGNAEPAGLIKPALVVEFAKDEGSDIHRGYGTTASYLHRHTAVGPERSVDLTAGEAGAGTVRPNYEMTGALLTGHREIHEGPVIGLGGLRHWTYAGLVDAFIAEPGAGWKAKGGGDLPLLPGFSLLRIRPLSASYGMGSIEGWMPAGDENGEVPWGFGYPMVLLDQYRMQQLVFGHVPSAGEDMEGDVGWHWLENHLSLPVSRSVAASNVVDIVYSVDGEWVGASAAIWAKDLDVIRVSYDNGVEITANSGEEEFDAGGVLLPRFGWVARKGDEVFAWTALKDGVVADFSKSEAGIFVNGRRLDDWKEGPRFDGLNIERGSETEWVEKNLNASGAVVDFGVIKTDGCVLLRKEGSDYVLTAFPRTADFTLLMNASAFRAPFSVESIEGQEKETRPEAVDGGEWWRLPLNGALEYRFPGGR
jgi:hypothetical protein